MAPFVALFLILVRQAIGASRGKPGKYGRRIKSFGTAGFTVRSLPDACGGGNGACVWASAVTNVQQAQGGSHLRDPSEAAAALGPTGTDRVQSCGLAAQRLTRPPAPKGVWCPGQGASTGHDPADQHLPPARGVHGPRQGWTDVSTWLGASGHQLVALGHSESPGLRALLRDMGVTAPSTVGAARVSRTTRG